MGVIDINMACDMLKKYNHRVLLACHRLYVDLLLFTLIVILKFLVHVAFLDLVNLYCV